MIDDFNHDRTGWARFSDDRVMRYRLARAITPRAVGLVEHPDPTILRRVVFIMLNPSTADAFKLDPTVSKCCRFARRWDADVLEVVNLFAFRSSDPKHLYDRWIRNEPIGDDIENDRAILDAVAWADVRVIAAWGNHGSLKRRADYVRTFLRERHVDLAHLGTTAGGHPLHPLARGKSFIPLDREPVVWG